MIFGGGKEYDLRLICPDWVRVSRGVLRSGFIMEYLSGFPPEVRHGRPVKKVSVFNFI